MKVQERLWEIVEVAKPGDRASRAFDIFILTLIFLNVLAVIVGTVESVSSRYGAFLDAFELISILIFTSRVWRYLPGH